MPSAFKHTSLLFLPLLINILLSQDPDPQIGDKCVTDVGELGFLDCELCCWDTGLLSWLGDGWCDDIGGDDLLCPLNDDGVINVLDVVIMVNIILAGNE